MIVVSESDILPGALRSRTREVWRWQGGGEQDSFDGDPASPQTYEWVRHAPGVAVIIDLESADQSRAVLRALRSVRTDAAALMLSGDVEDVDCPGDGTLVRHGQLRDVLRVDVEEEMERLEAERRAFCLKQFAEGDDVVPILIHDDPDPDAVSSALAVVALLGGNPDRNPIVTLDAMTRPENRRMAELLRIRVTEITRAELMQFERVITVDSQPAGLQEHGRPRYAVVDHHPRERSYTAEFSDIRPHYGATATMLTEYLRAMDEKLINPDLATALLFGIRTDTDSLMRGVTPADVSAYAHLQTLADVQLVRRFDRPSYGRETAHAFGDGLAGAVYDNELMVVHVGQLADDEAFVLADLADFCITVENITWVVAAAEHEDELVLTIRHTGTGEGAGALARTIAALGGSGGGHDTMGRVSLPMERARELLDGNMDAPTVLRLVRRSMDQEPLDATRPDLRPAHRA
jgi:nanoRNase/pAp phosphatase (c-di-AMP/oligoRNAs hydrolase)